jgi:uncharacterized membrane protein
MNLETSNQRRDEVTDAFMTSEARAAFIAHLISQSRAARSIVGNETEQDVCFSERLADRVAAIGGSWSFIFVFILIVMGWTVSNSLGLGAYAVDPFPYNFLNLGLAMLASLQAPIIMMSQNRQAEKDRLAMAHDYEVNLKAEIAILELHEKLDEIRARHLEQLISMQHEQTALLTLLQHDRTSQIDGLGPTAPLR